MKTKQVEINKEILNKCKTNDDFTELSVEVAKETGEYLAIAANICEYNAPKLLERNDAIVIGLMVRIQKLFISFLDNICQKRLEIVQILSRCLIETMINLLYLFQESDKNKYDNYVKYSLKTEKDFYNHIEKNINEQGYEKDIEKRMKLSILKLFKENNIKIEDFNIKMHSWGENNIYGRFKKLNMEEFYKTYTILSHSIHGNWQDLQFFHLNHIDGKYEPNYSWLNPDTRCINPILLIIIDVCKKYLDFKFKDIDDLKILKEKLNNIQDRILLLTKFHEKYIQSLANKYL